MITKAGVAIKRKDDERKPQMHYILALSMPGLSLTRPFYARARTSDTFFFSLSDL